MDATADQHRNKDIEIDLHCEKSNVMKTPKRVLHFSDGTLEEYSSDEEDVQDTAEYNVDMKSLGWRPWFSHVAKSTGKSVLGAVDNLGGGLAYYLGITSPKYFYEIEEYNRSVDQEQEEKKQVEAEMVGWKSLSDEGKNSDSITEEKIISTDDHLSSTQATVGRPEEPVKERF